MGEYATYAGHEVKIGTCEDMYYLRYDQRFLVGALPGNVDPARDATDGLRFRFPWPDEDKRQPGPNDHEQYERAVALHGLTVPAGVEHYSVQFSAPAGYLTSLPCPESADPMPAGIRIHRNGFPGAVQLVQQRDDGTVLRAIFRCGGCGTKWSAPTLADAEPAIVACRSEADRLPRDDGRRQWWHAIADRIAAGYHPRHAETQRPAHRAGG